jgi:V-type H+-transporting ATPase 16kDa proteolipid subunit
VAPSARSGVMLTQRLMLPVKSGDYPLFTGFVHLAAGLACGLTGLSAGYAIGIVGDSVMRIFLSSSLP